VDAKEFQRWLKKRGILINPSRGKGGHAELFNPANGLKTVMPVGRKDMKTGTVEGIKKQLGLK
jgi:mRNA interferase HicA